MVVAEQTRVADVLGIILQSGQPLLESAELSQIYRNPKLGDTVKSLTFHLIYRGADTTLSSKDINQVRQKITSSLTKEGMHVRE